MKDQGISITWLGHATVLYRSPKGKHVLGDAWVNTNPACPEAQKELPPIDLVLITHAHGDHIGDLIPIQKKHGADIVCIFELGNYFESKGLPKVTGMGKGGTVSLHGIRVTMVNAVHSSSLEGADSAIPAGDPAGYVIEFENGTRVYHAGDTAVFYDMKLIGDIYHPSIAVLPIGDHYTMSPLEAAHAAKLLGVKTVIPVHYATFDVLTGRPEHLREHLKGSGIEVVDIKPGQTIGAPVGSAA